MKVQHEHQPKQENQRNETAKQGEFLAVTRRPVRERAYRQAHNESVNDHEKTAVGAEFLVL